MSFRQHDSDPDRDGGSSSPSPASPTPSARVRLEAEILRTELAEQRDAAGETGAASDTERLVVLIVLADPALRRYISACLRAITRFRVCDVASAREALELAAHTPPRIAIVDQSAEH